MSRHMVREKTLSPTQRVQVHGQWRSTDHGAGRLDLSIAQDKEIIES